jgi:hypothetical protein
MRAGRWSAPPAEGVKDVSKPVETLERLSTKALGVLQSQGVYALMLFLFSRTGDEKLVSPLIRRQLYAALRTEFPILKITRSWSSLFDKDSSHL